MASVFIDLLPDETLHSGVSSLFDVMDCSSAKKINALLFGNAKARTITDLACRLDHLIEALPSGHDYTVDQIINQHTLFPFYAPFLPIERSNRLKDDMRGDNASGMHLRAGITTKGIFSPDWLRFCPVCVKEDRAKYKRTFWHRNHQIPGVNICFIHGVLLENSSARTRNRNELPRCKQTGYQNQKSVSCSSRWSLRYSLP